MSKGPEREDIGDLCFEDGLETVGAAGQDPADDLVGDLGGGDVQNTLDQSGLDKFFHRLAAGSRGMEDQAVESSGFECLPHGGHARRGDAEHGHGQRRLVAERRDLMLNHTGHGAGGVAQYLARDGIQARDVDDRRHQCDVAQANISGRVAAGDRRDHELGQADRQSGAWLS